MATTVSLEQILGYVPLTGTIQQIKTGIPQPLPDAFFKTTENVIGNHGRYTVLTGQRKTAKRVEYGAPALRRELKEVGQKDVTLIHTYEEQLIDVLTFQNLRNYNSYDAQRRGINELARQAAEFKQLFENLRTASVLQTLATGLIYFDANGNLLPTSSGAAVTIDFLVAAANKAQGLASDGSTPLISASWGTTSTAIDKDCRRIKKTAVQRTGYRITTCYYGMNIPTYIANNTSAQAYLSRNPVKNQQYLDTGEIPGGLFGIDNWVPAYEAFWVDKDDTLQEIWGADLCVFTPDVNVGWWDFMEGSYQVPTTLNILADGMAAADSMKDVQGMFRYAVPTHNPPTYNTFNGDTFLGILKNPDAVYLLDVTP